MLLNLELPKTRIPLTTESLLVNLVNEFALPHYLLERDTMAIFKVESISARGCPERETMSSFKVKEDGIECRFFRDTVRRW